MEKLRQVAEEVVAILAGVTVEDEHAAGAADRRGRLRDELFREIEMEVGYAHGFSDSSGWKFRSGTRRSERRDREQLERLAFRLAPERTIRP